MCPCAPISHYNGLLCNMYNNIVVFCCIEPLTVCRISANCYNVNYFPGYDEVNVRVYIDGWHKHFMQLYPSVVWEPTLEVYC